MGLLSNGDRKGNKIWHIGDEDDAQSSNTHVVQRKRTIPHSAMKNNRTIIVCCNNTHQGAPCTDKQTCACVSDLITLPYTFMF